MPVKALFMASEVRSGSTYIAETISYSLFQSYGIECWDLALEKFSALAEDRRPALAKSILTGIFISQGGFRCAKLMVKDIVGLLNAVDEDPSLAESFLSDECAWIIVRRRNKFRQAVSLAYAQTSRVYHHYSDSGEPADQNVVIAPEEVMPHYGAIAVSDDYLGLLANVLPRCHTVFYEDFMENPRACLTVLLKELDIPVDIENLKIGDPKLVVTQNDKKVALEDQFKKYFLSNF